MSMTRKMNPSALALYALAGSSPPFRVHFCPPDDAAGGGGGGGGPDPAIARAKQELEERDAQIATLNQQIADLNKNVVSEADKKELAKLKAEKEEAEKKRLAEQGELQKLLDQAREELAAEKKNREDAEKKNKEQVRDLRLSNFLEREIPKHTTIATPQVIGALGLRDYFSFDEKNGSFTVVDPMTKTTPRNKNGAPMTPEEFVASKIAETPWMKDFVPKGGSGGQSTSGDGSGADGEFTSEDVANMSTEEYIKNQDKILAQADANTRPMPVRPKKK